MSSKGLLTAVLLLACGGRALASGASYTGAWTIDLRNAEQKKQHLECGQARFELTQDGENITGSHTFVTPGCSRENEGGPGTVNGLIVDGTAVLVVTSARTGDMAMGKAVRKGNRLHWHTVHQFKKNAGADGDSPLILKQSVLMFESADVK